MLFNTTETPRRALARTKSTEMQQRRLFLMNYDDKPHGCTHELTRSGRGIVMAVHNIIFPRARTRANTEEEAAVLKRYGRRGSHKRGGATTAATDVDDAGGGGLAGTSAIAF